MFLNVKPKALLTTDPEDQRHTAGFLGPPRTTTKVKIPVKMELCGFVVVDHFVLKGPTNTSTCALLTEAK